MNMVLLAMAAAVMQNATNVRLTAKMSQVKLPPEDGLPSQ